MQVGNSDLLSLGGSWPMYLTNDLTVSRLLLCPGFPVYDYNLATLRQALDASVAEVNARSLSPYLFRAFRSSIKRVSAQCLSSTPLATAFCLCALVSALGTLFNISFQVKMIAAGHLFQTIFGRERI